MLAAVAESGWVIDGNYSAVRDIVWRRATAIVWLDYGFMRVFSRALRRTARRIITAEPLYSGNRETVRNAVFDRDGVPWWVMRTHGKRRREFPALLRRPEYRHAVVVHLRTPAAAETFRAEVVARTQASAASGSRLASWRE